MTEPDLTQFEGDFERLPRLSDEMRKLGDTAVVTFQDNGKVISADVLQKAYKLKGLKIKARDTFVYTVQHNDARKSLFVGSTNYTNLRELAAIKKSNKNSFVGVKVKVSRIAEGDPTTANIKFEAA